MGGLRENTSDKMASLCLYCSLYWNAFPSDPYTVLSLTSDPWMTREQWLFKTCRLTRNASTGHPFKSGQRHFWRETNTEERHLSDFLLFWGLSICQSWQHLGNRSLKGPPNATSPPAVPPSLCFIFLQNPYHCLKLQYTFICLHQYFKSSPGDTNVLSGLRTTGLK